LLMPQFDHAASCDFFRRSMNAKSCISTAPNHHEVRKHALQCAIFATESS
jgi:hypothetical protein